MTSGWLTTFNETSVVDCGGNLTDSRGRFTSPNYPYNYPNNVRCEWKIQARGDKTVYLHFLDFNLEGGSCNYDSVSVYDGPSTSHRLLGKICETSSRNFRSSGNYMTVVFRNYIGYETTPGPASCRYNCGYHLGSCSCASSCRYYSNCCYDYNDYCQTTPTAPATADPQTTGPASCRYNCGYHLGSCSCASSCRYYGNCCYDYNDYCQTTTAAPGTGVTHDYGSCRNNCGYYVGICSCTSSCRYYGDCCYDYNDYCQTTTNWGPETTVYHPPCGGNLYGSGSFSSPYYPNYYHDNAYCVWRISAPSGQRVFLTFTDIEMENCCSCDYITVHDGSSVSSRPLGKICSNSSSDAFHSSSQYLTVVFRTDGSVVGRGFHATFSSSLPTSSGRVDCSSDNMNIVIEKSYLNSLGYSGYDLYLNDQSCRPQVLSYQVVFSFPLNTCGTRRTFSHGRVVYGNAVRAYPSSYGEITRQSHFQLHIFCRMEQDTMVQIMYEAREVANGNITGVGRFNATMAFYTSSSFYYQVYDSPYVVNLNQYLYVQVRLRRSDSSLVLFLDTCVASPSPHDFSTRAYDLVRNGCRRDSTYYSYTSGTRDVAQFRFQAFKFLRSHPSVYLQCKINICQANDYSSRCSRGCFSRKARDLSSSGAGDSATVVLGPIQLRDLKKPDEKLLENNVIKAEA
ncbi:deleted in malignant brain tumors 1 protein [Megalops cyprinoides]|uniref:deleted in malignant brain tumors 1 protein n=1 Tax=Megalops cyprinoides TaxID=118141 RepID=UPI0018640C36|nr:deleted in malignant brain tumors 1 protein [Megalops cyprinoides]